MNRFMRCGVAIILLAATPSFGAKENTMSVQVREGQLRSAPSYLSRVLATLDYTTSVTILKEQGPWMLVRPADSTTQGWMHSVSLTKKNLKLESGDKDATTAVSTDEQALAGKGFNSDVEAKFKERNAKINFAAVDKMETITIPIATITSFLKEGDVKPAKGGAL